AERAQHRAGQRWGRCLVQAVAEILVQPGDVDAGGTLVHATRATSAELGESRVFQFAGASFPRPADSTGVGFSAESVATDGLKIRAGVQAGAATDAVQGLAENGIVAHAHAAIVDENQVEFTRPARFAGQSKWGIVKRRAEKAGVGSQTLPGGAGRQELDKR